MLLFLLAQPQGVLAQSLAVARPSMAPTGESSPREPGEPAEPTPDGGAYVGSKTCAKCHAELYKVWRATRHSYSILTGSEARQAGFPLPSARHSGKTPASQIRGWEDVSYVVGGRQRIAYADRRGRVQDTSYHHRVGGWDGFPAKQMKECGPCHFTAFGAGEPHLDDSAVPERWAELNIGCEACHGPGGRHVKDLFDADMLVDVSSRLCGSCHTARGRVLPMDDLHRTHDLVQVWHSDPHATGVQRHSHNAFCSRCHSPYQGDFNATAEDAATKRVFAEAKQTITCIACHNPHDLTNPHYSRGEVSLRPPLPSKLHAYRGNDLDFETSDFRELKSNQEVCVQCHRGADRIDLDHAGASCSDCHNTFHRSRGAASRVVHDANQPTLTCRSCHRDADHLMAILYRDPDFLQPEYIHNLRKLPEAVVAKYGLRHTKLVHQRAATLSALAGGRNVAPRRYSEKPAPAPPEPADAEELQRAAARYEQRARAAVNQLLERAPHEPLADQTGVRLRQAALAQTPEEMSAALSLALAYVELRAFSAAREILELAVANDSPKLLAPAVRKSAVEKSQLLRELHSLAAGLQPLFTQPETRALQLWLQAYVALADGRAAAAGELFAEAAEIDPENAGFLFYDGLSRFLQGDKVAIASLQHAMALRPGHRGALIVMGLAYLQRGERLSRAQTMLEEAIAQGSGDPETHTVLGRIYLRRGMTEQARRAFHTAIALDPDYLGASYALARAYRSDEEFDAAIGIYSGIIDRWPDDFEAHYRAGELLKYRSDQVAFQLLRDREVAAPPEISPRQWRRQLATLKRQSIEYGQRALSFLETARRLRPQHLDSVRQLCDLHRRFARLTQARDCFAQLTQREPMEWLYPYRLGTILIELGAYDDAARSLQVAREMAPIVGDVYLALGLAYIRDERVDEAIAALEQGRMYEAFNPALYTNLGAAYATRGQLELARGALERSLDLSTFPLPRLHLTYTNLALVYWQQGQRDQTTQALKNALHVYPGYAYAQRLLEEVQSEEVQSEEMQSRTQATALDAPRPFVFNGSLERFGLVTTVAFGSE